MKYLLTIFIFLFLCISLVAQKTKQDSINVFIQQRTAAIDSISKKTSMKEFQLWLDENVSSKSMREGSLNELWSSFITIKLDEWIRKNKIIVPRN